MGYEQAIRDNFNITSDEEIQTSVTYTTEGTLTIEVDPESELTPDEIENLVEESLATELGIHPQNIEVEYNPETNVVTYVITSEDAESLKDVQNEISDPEFENKLNEDLAEEEISVTDVTPPSEIIANIEISVDATNTEDVEDALENVETQLKENDENAIVETNVAFVTSAPTAMPSI